MLPVKNTKVNDVHVHDIEIGTHRNYIEFNPCGAHNLHGCHHVGFFRPSAISVIVVLLHRAQRCGSIKSVRTSRRRRRISARSRRVSERSDG